MFGQMKTFKVWKSGDPAVCSCRHLGYQHELKHVLGMVELGLSGKMKMW